MTLGQITLLREEVYQRIVLSDIIDIKCFRVGIVEAFEAGVWHVFLVLCPRDAILFENVHDRGNLIGNSVQVIITNPEIASANDRDVIGFAWVGNGVIIGEEDTLRCKECEIALTEGLVVILESFSLN